MSPWLRKSLVLWFAGTALVAVTGLQSEWLRVRAAETEVQLTPEELSQQLSDYVWREDNRRSSVFGVTGEPKLPLQLISSADLTLLEEEGVRALLRRMADLWYIPQFRTRRAEGGTDERVTVEVNAAVQWKVRPVICVKEGDFWKIDLISTYMKWADVPESQKRDKIQSITGVFLPGPMSESDNRELCATQMKKIGLAIKQYTQDYDERMPRAMNWQDAV